MLGSLAEGALLAFQVYQSYFNYSLVCQTETLTGDYFYCEFNI